MTVSNVLEDIVWEVSRVQERRSQVTTVSAFRLWATEEVSLRKLSPDPCKLSAANAGTFTIWVVRLTAKFQVSPQGTARHAQNKRSFCVGNRTHPLASDKGPFLISRFLSCSRIIRTVIYWPNQRTSEFLQMCLKWYITDIRLVMPTQTRGESFYKPDPGLSQGQFFISFKKLPFQII